MHPIRNTFHRPPGGWYYKQAETGFIVDDLSLGFWEAVDRILDHRRVAVGTRRIEAGKVALDRNAVAQELANYTCLRIGNNPRFCRGEEYSAAMDFGAGRRCPTCAKRSQGR